VNIRGKTRGEYKGRGPEEEALQKIAKKASVRWCGVSEARTKGEE